MISYPYVIVDIQGVRSYCISSAVPGIEYLCATLALRSHAPPRIRVVIIHKTATTTNIKAVSRSESRLD